MPLEVNRAAIRIRPYTPEDHDQTLEILLQGIICNTDPLFHRRVKHYTTPLVILTKSILYTSLIQIALTVRSSLLLVPGVMDLQEVLTNPQSIYPLLQQFIQQSLRPSSMLMWVLVSLAVAATTLVDIQRWSRESNAKYVKRALKEDLSDLSGYYQLQTFADKDKKNRSQLWVACLDSHPQLILGCVALDDQWAHTEYLKRMHLARGKSDETFILPSKTDAELRRLSVHQDYRRLGISKLLLETLVDYAKANGFRRVKFTTITFQTAAITAYIRFGFTKEKTAKMSKLIDLWFGSLDLYATEEEKELQKSRQEAMLKEVGAA